MRRLLILAALGLSSAWGATTNVRVFGTTSTAAIIAYTAEKPAVACKVEVSIESDYSPLVHDVNTTLFSGSDQDSRTGSLTNGRERFFVVGGVSGTASDGKIYSRALQANTTHYFRINQDSACGTGTGTGTFHTKNIPFGSTHAPWLPVSTPGEYPFPTIDYDRDNRATATYIDPLSGILIRPINMPNEQSYPVYSLSFTSTALGTNWSNPDYVLADDANSATYSGSTNDWLAIKRNAGNWLTAYPMVKWIKFYVKGSSNGSGDDLILEMCITTDGTTCRSDIQEITLSATPDTQHCYPYDGSPTTCGTDPTPVNTWSTFNIIRTELDNNANFGVMVRKKGTGGGTTTLQYAEVEMYGELGTEYFYGGDAPSCQDAVKTDGGGNAGYYCLIPFAASAGHFYWVARDTGEARFLGKLRPNGANITEADAYTIWSTWDETELGTIYVLATDTSGDQIIVKGVHDGNVDTSEVSGYYAGHTWTNLTPDPNHLEALIAAFDASYDSSKFACSNSGIAVMGNYFATSCRRNGLKDQIAWYAVYKLGDRQPYGSCTGCGMQAATTTYNANAEIRWCADHSIESFHNELFVGYAPGALNYRVTYTDCSGDCCSSPNLTACGGGGSGQTTITVTSSHSTPGEPYSSTNPDAELQVAAVGDVFRIEGTGNRELVRLATKNSPTSWVIDRSWGLDPSRAHDSGESMRALCAAKKTLEYGDNANVFWDFINDPNGDDPDYHTRDWADFVGGHGHYTAGYRMNHFSGNQGYGVKQGTLLAGIVDQDADFTIGMSGKCGTFHGKSAPCIPDGETWQSHNSSAHQVLVSGPEKAWGMDGVPYRGVGASDLQLGSLTNVSGDLWKGTNTDLDRKYFDTIAVCGVHPLQDVSNPTTASHQIQDTSADNYKYCYAEKNGDCRTDSTAGEVFVNCPELTGSPVCNANVIGLVKDDDVCVGDRPNFGHAVVQIRMDRDRKPQANSYRRLLTPFNPFHAWGVFANARQLPDVAADGSGLWSQTAWNRHEGPMAYSFLVPPLPPDDTVDRTRFVPISVQVTGPTNTDNAIVDFGYNESFECTSRLEGCVKGTTEPYQWAIADSGSITGVTCGSGCTVEIPGISGHVLYYRIKYRDSGDNVIATSRTEVVAVP
jgi:hypothetical protein